MIAFLIIELSSFGWLKRAGEEAPLFFDPRTGIPLLYMGEGNGTETARFGLDPQLTWSHDVQESLFDESEQLKYQDGYYIFLHHNSKYKNTLKIVTTGGSTTDANSRVKSWPQILFERLRDQNLPFNIELYNGGVGGFDSTQEAFKSARDLPKIMPDFHISLNGVNEENESPFYKSNFFQKLFISRIAESSYQLLLPNITTLIKKQFMEKKSFYQVNLGPAYSDIHERWLSNLRLMYAISREWNYQFISVLQPHLNNESYEPNAREIEVLNTNPNITNYKSFFPNARNIAKDYEWIIDGTDILKGESDLFYDDCHVKVKANEMIAEFMLELILNRLKN